MVRFELEELDEVSEVSGFGLLRSSRRLDVEGWGEADEVDDEAVAVAVADLTVTLVRDPWWCL